MRSDQPHVPAYLLKDTKAVLACDTVIPQVVHASYSDTATLWLNLFLFSMRPVELCLASLRASATVHCFEPGVQSVCVRVCFCFFCLLVCFCFYCFDSCGRV